ncbi:malto-oligosyltrehalose synthase [Stenotrophomonas sp. HITSZ_GD]|uniref:malto-oligosyltrehalose synthase n=1 Tax=Stenotrophomonas sp. HITSZ_GD TaxID=3037248 RepID=UPI00240E6E25|nr:malto-oligosyltrehalose synthase [Stenotrophomonas sp. HITSZ_GD]MDG2526083.1 malto-oligosyltrehalose synthase [Stenotrophomonas sp. HITSZ_GD]
MIAPRATVRLQLHAGFDLHAATAQLPYFAALGVSHLYLSPIATAVPGSPHGYDGIDPTRINPELGGEDAFLALSHRARALGIGLILDLVPNHLATHPGNAWWWDVLRHGRRSRHAGWFDIDWRAPGHDGQLWLPVLDRPCAQAVAEGLLQLEFDPEGQVQLRHHDQPYPLRPQTLPSLSPAALRAWVAELNAQAREGDPRLQRLIDRQPYRLAWWRVGNDMINYRRFFDITSLAGLRVELPAVFDAVHALPLRLVAEGHVDGVRIDHIDGLADPAGYLRKLRARLDQAGRRRGLAPGALALYVEKILAPGETLPPDWACDGTTGYDFMDQVSGVLHARGGRTPLRQLWRAESGRSGDFGQEQRQAREEILRGPLQAEFIRTVRAQMALARLDPATREFSPQMLARALACLLREYPVYRSYAGADGLDAAGRAHLAGALARARVGQPQASVAALEALARWLGEDRDAGRSQVALRRILRRRFEQLSAPLNAKAVEDTAFYRHGVLLSRNEVGSEPDHFALTTAQFHETCRQRARSYPRALLATATHDHKRGEDVRARLAVLSEWPTWWREQVRGFDAIAGDLPAAMPDPGDAAMLWQMIVGAWPLALGVDDHDGLRDYATRLWQWQCKALREAKLRSSWLDPQADYEDRVQAFIDATLCSRAGLPLRRALCRAARRIAVPGARNGLAQACLRLTVPGVPDLYQGTEGWDLSLVDPDNRRPVDYPQRQRWLDDPRDWPTLLHDWADGAVKAQLIARLLRVRAEYPDLFARGRYQPLSGAGERVLAFLRDDGERQLLVAVARLGADEAAHGLALPPRTWGQAALPCAPGRYRDVLEQRDVVQRGRRVALSTLLARSPVAVWLSATD